MGDTLPDVAFEHLLNYVTEKLEAARVRPESFSVDWSSLPANVRNDLTEAWEDDYDGVGPSDQPQSVEQYLERRCASLSPQEVLDAWLTWNGIINWSRSIRDAVRGIEDAGVVK